MIFEKYINQISFRFLQPHEYSKTFRRLSRWLKKINVSLEVLNTRLPENGKATKEKLVDILRIPRMSTFAIGAIINRAVEELEENACFVNVGVWNGFTLFSGIKGNSEKKCIGIDNFSEFGGPKEAFLKKFNEIKSTNHFFYEMDYKDYFKNSHAGEIGFYIYDGNHEYEHQLEGLKVAEPHFSENCIILVDDTNCREPRQATLDFIKNSKNNYTIILDKTTYGNEMPTFWNGIMLLRRVPTAEKNS